MGFGDLSLLDGEQVDRGLNTTPGADRAKEENPDMVLLTNRRVIHLKTNGRGRKAVFVSLQDIDSVELLAKRQTRGAVVWGGLSFLVAVMLWQVWDHPWASALAALAVMLIGVYLVVDRLSMPGRVRISFSAGSSNLECEVGADGSGDNIMFINRLFDLKSQQLGDNGRRRFAPR